MSGQQGSEPPISEEERSYFRTIEERFCALRGAAILLSPRDWALIGPWWKERVPLALILESIEEVIAARILRGEPARSVGSLAYVRNEVQRRFRLHRELVAIRRGEEEESARLRREIRLHLGRVSKRLVRSGEAARERDQEELARALITAGAEVRMLRPPPGEAVWGPILAEERLEQVQSELMDAARSALGPGEGERLKAQAKKLLESRGLRMTSQAHRETLVALEESLLRQALGIPRIVLLAEG